MLLFVGTRLCIYHFKRSVTVVGVLGFKFIIVIFAAIS